MIKFQLFFLLISINLSQKLEKTEKKSNIFFAEKEVDEGIYNIILQNSNSILIYLHGLRTSKKEYGLPQLNFKIIFADKDKKYYYICHEKSGLYIGVKKYEKLAIIGKFGKKELQIEWNNKIIIDEKNSHSNYQWEFLKEKGKESSFIIRNKLGCILVKVKNQFFCAFNEKRTFFNLMQIYQEKQKNMTKEEKKLLDDEPIDVLI